MLGGGWDGSESGILPEDGQQLDQGLPLEFWASGVTRSQSCSGRNGTEGTATLPVVSWGPGPLVV